MTDKDQAEMFKGRDNPARHQFPPLRTFTVKRVNILSGEQWDMTVEAHRYQTDQSGNLLFEQMAWDTFAHQKVQRMPIAIAAGTWTDCIEISAHLEVRPAGTVN